MMPVKMMIRSAAHKALSKPLATMAKTAVFDSRLLPVIDIAEESHIPAILIYTDQDEITNHNQNGGQTWKREIVLVIELAITRNFTHIETDSELETVLDLFEAEVETALLNQSVEALAFREACQAIDKIEILPFRSAEQARTYAMRQMMFSLCLRKSLIGCGGVQGTTVTLPDGMPELAELIRTDPAFESTRLMLTGGTTGGGAGGSPVSINITSAPLRMVSTSVDFVDPADPNRLAALGRTKGPDGRIEIELPIQTEQP